MALNRQRRFPFTWRELLAGGLLIAAAAVCIRLGFWQLDRLTQRREVNTVIAEARVLPAIRLDEAGLDSVSRDPARHLHRRAVARGEFVPEGEILLRGRAHQGSPGVHLVAPFRLEGGGLLLVNRGWLPAPDAATVDPRPHRVGGRRDVDGLLQLVPSAPEGAIAGRIDLSDTTVMSYRRLDRATLESLVGEPLPELYLQRLADPAQAGSLPVAIAPPTLDDGPHLIYAVQWFGFAAVALGGLFVVSWRRRFPRSDHPSEGVQLASPEP